MEKTLAEVKEGLRAMAYNFAVRIEPVYKKLNWTWCDKKETPTVDEIEETILGLIDDLNGENSIATGGLAVCWDTQERCYYISFSDSAINYY